MVEPAQLESHNVLAGCILVEVVAQSITILVLKLYLRLSSSTSFAQLTMYKLEIADTTGLSVHPISLSVRPISFTVRPIGLAGLIENKANSTLPLELE